jgi:hypothetical protein
MMSVEPAIPAEPVIPAEHLIPDVSADELMARKFVHRIRKLRWMGMEDAARSLELELRNAPFASSLIVMRRGAAAVEVALSSTPD